MATDPADDIWVADTGHDRIVEYSPSGRLVATFGQDLDQPAGIATDATGHIWVADTGHDRVVEFSPVGRVLAIFGSPGSGRGQLNQPVALAVTPFGVLRRPRPHLADPRHRERFGVTEPNISAFRRQVCGDFTTALRFSDRPAGYPQSPQAITLAAAEAGLLTAQQEVFANPAPQVPVTNEPVPRQ